MNKITLLLVFLAGMHFARSQETILINDDFNDNSFGWYEDQAGDLHCKVNDGHYYLNNVSGGSRWVYNNIDKLSPDEEDFTIEVKMKQTSGDKDYAYGILHSMYSDNSSYRKFFITANGQFKVDHFYNEESHIQVNYTNNNSINKGLNQYNTLKVMKTANVLTYYINDVKVHTYYENSYYGARIAFFTGEKMEVEVDHLKISKYPLKINLVENAGKIGDKVKLSANINSEYTELSPIVSPDGKTLYINRDDYPENMGDPNDDQDVWVASLDANGEWLPLKNIGKPINNKGKNFTVSVSPDNNSLVVANEYNADGTAAGQGLSITYRTSSGWSVPEAFEIEDYYNDHQYVSYYLCNDNKTLMMAVGRKEGLGEKDLYVSFLKNGNKWSKPLHMGNVINTPGDESKPFLAADNKTLYFSSTGHLGYGADDVFVSKKLDDSWTNWSTPKNLGPKINTPKSELGYFLDAKGEVAYFSSKGDIWKIENSEKPEPVTLVSGTVYNKKTKQPMQANIVYYDLVANVELGIAKSDPQTGAYKIVLPSGKKYSFIAQQKEFYPISENIDLNELTAYNEFTKDLYLLPIEKGEIIRLNNIFFEFNKADLMPESFNELDRLYDILVENKNMMIEIGGHTDDKGSDIYNSTLSNNRAKSVVDYLVKKGIDIKRLTAVGYGKTKPEVPNDTDENRAINRRVEFKVL
ncbi:MAG: OmpA family protein [Flavobacteriales bacterium]|nr:OmpA family protein [Flavobacteriales bacterium]